MTLQDLICMNSSRQALRISSALQSVRILLRREDFLGAETQLITLLRLAGDEASGSRLERASPWAPSALVQTPEPD